MIDSSIPRILRVIRQVGIEIGSAIGFAIERSSQIPAATSFTCLVARSPEERSRADRVDTGHGPVQEP